MSQTLRSISRVSEGRFRFDKLIKNAKNKMPVLLKTIRKSFCRNWAVKGVGESDFSFSLPLSLSPLSLHQEGRGGQGDGLHPAPRSRKCLAAEPVVNTGIQMPSPLAYSLIKLYGFALFPETSTHFNNNWRPTRLRL